LKIIIQIVVAIVIVVACAKGGEAAWRFYEFKDAVEQEARFFNAKTTSQLHKRVMELADEHEVGLEYEDIVVAPRQGQTHISVSYNEAIALVPGFYTRNHQFEFDVSVRVPRPLIVDEK
jgi:hypothetical protein